jgi:pyrimidine deaminase RibD-like protein
MSTSKYMKRAIEVAAQSRCHYRHGCVVVSNGKVVAAETNRRVGNPDSEWRKAHIHAEAAALMAAGDKAYGASVYIARVSKSGVPAESRPCKKCERLINKYKVMTVVWT